MAGQTRINGNLIDTGTDPEDIVSISAGDARYPKLDGPNTLSGDLTVDNGTLFVDSANGRVGVGTSSPSFDLDITGTVKVSAEVFTGQYRLLDSGSIYRPVLSMDADNTVIETGTTSGARSILFKTEGSEAARIDSSGNLLVGTTSEPDWKLAVDANDKGVIFDNNHNTRISDFEAVSGGSPYVWNIGANSSLKLQAENNAISFLVSGDGNDRRAAVQCGHASGSFSNFTGDFSLNPLGGNVGVGLFSPQVKLHVDGRIYSKGPNTSQSPSFTVGPGFNTGIYNANDDNVGALGFAVNGSEAVRIDSDGNVGIGTSSPSQPLHVNGDSKLGNNKKMSFAGSFSTTTSPKITLNVSSGSFPRIGFSLYILGRDSLSSLRSAYSSIYGVIRAGSANADLLYSTGEVTIASVSVSFVPPVLEITLNVNDGGYTHIEGYADIIENRRGIDSITVSD